MSSVRRLCTTNVATVRRRRRTSGRILAGLTVSVALAAGSSAAVTVQRSGGRQAAIERTAGSRVNQARTVGGTDLLVFARATAAGGGLFRIRSDGRGLRRLTSGRDEAPAWSSDGSRLAFSRSRDEGRSYEIYLATGAGGHAHAITHGGGFAQAPSWTPDGSWIVFSASGGAFKRSTDPSCAPNVWLVRPNGTGLHRLLTRGIEPVYSPDGRRLAFVRPDARERPWLYVVGADGRGVRRIGIGSHPSWSPDGRRIVVERPEGPNRMSDLWIVRVKNGRARRLTRTGQLSELGPVWSPDGRWIAVSMVRGSRQDIYALPASGGEAHAITHSPRGGGNYDPAWLPLPPVGVTSNRAPAPLTLPLPAGHRSTEANIAVNPADPNDVLVVARDEDQGRLIGLRMWRSHDGGHSFFGGMLVPRSLDGWPANASDPVALFDNRGQPAPAFLALRYGPSTWQTRIMLGRRSVISAEYGPPFPTFAEPSSHTWYDKPWAAFNPRDGRAYVSWTERGTAHGPLEDVYVASALPGSQFSKARRLGPGSGSVPVIGRGSTVLIVWYDVPNLSTRGRILSSVSTDHGQTWSRPDVVAGGVNARGYSPFPTVVRAGSGFVACWQENTVFPRERIACSHSPNGHAWSSPRIVAQPPGAGDGDQPALAASPDGRLWLAFYRFEHRSTSVELWSSCTGNTWRQRAVLMHRPVPRSGSSFLGDYEGLAATDKSVLAAFTMPVRAGAFRQVVQVSRFPIGR